MLKTIAVPRNLTTKLWELNHFDFSSSEQNGETCVFTMNYIISPFFLTLITHIFLKDGQTLRPHKLDSVSIMYLLLHNPLSLFSCSSIFHLDPIIWYCITVSGSLKINKLLSYLDKVTYASHVSACWKISQCRVEWVNNEGRLWTKSARKKCGRIYLVLMCWL